jgi:hypothetical protein
MSCNLTPSSEILFRDQQHAARLFVDDNFRLAPKYKFLFHVAFGINAAALRNAELQQRHKNEIGMLVKEVDLPSFDVQSDTLNQYNRKKVVQYQHKFKKINIKFHDDNMSLINQLWQNYYSYYYADSAATGIPGAYTRNATLDYNHITAPYGLDNRSIAPFFKYIKIYQMARHEFVCYTLINPIITSWKPDSVAYNGTDLMGSAAEIEYEAVNYSMGQVVPGDPEGFALEHYDQTPSPLSGQSVPNSPSFANAASNAKPYIESVTQQVNTGQNTKGNNSTGLTGIIKNVNSVVKAGVSGVNNIVFPAINVANTVVAVARKFL